MTYDIMLAKIWYLIQNTEISLSNYAFYSKNHAMTSNTWQS